MATVFCGDPDVLFGTASVTVQVGRRQHRHHRRRDHHHGPGCTPPPRGLTTASFTGRVRLSTFDHAPIEMRVVLMLADAAQVADNKLFILGGGLAIIPAAPAPLAIAAKIDVPWDRADRRHDWKLELLDADGMPVLINDRPVIVAGQFEVGRSEHLLPGTPLPCRWR